jgi:hypothetical protein
MLALLANLKSFEFTPILRQAAHLLPLAAPILLYILHGVVLCVNYATVESPSLCLRGDECLSIVGVPYFQTSERSFHQRCVADCSG